MEKQIMNMNNKVIIVTGGESGIGKAIAKQLFEFGANVVIADINVDTELKSDRWYEVKCDITNKKEIDEMVLKTIEEYGRIDGLVNNAGINLPRLLVDVKGEKPEYELNEADFELMVAVNQKGPFLCAQAVARHMIKQNSGVIVNISSEAGIQGSRGQSVYAATKAALNGFTKSWAKELGKYQIRVVGVAPAINEKTGLTNPEYNKALAYTRDIKVEELAQNYSESIPLGREGKLHEIADLVTYLLSDRSSYITGTVINISGGKS